jgi:5-(carboxyamino)imidazole ribonucleotide synthase
MADAPLPPGSTIGILGGGQLGRMLAAAAARLGLDARIFCEKEDAPAFAVSASHVCAPYDDTEALRDFAKSCDAITFEFENVPVAALEQVGELAPVFPGPRALQMTQDRLVEKDFVASLDIATAPYASVSSADQLAGALESIGAPAILKTRRFGYDGKGQVRLDANTDAAAAFDAVGGASSILEGFVRFDCEVSILAARARDGATVYYDLTENEHENQILKESRVPAQVPASVEEEARAIAGRIADALDYVGVLAVELFYCGAGAEHALRVNEIAPRVHNSGHWTIDACTVSQFENHIRAVAGWPLGSAERHSDAVMTNLIGTEVEAWRELSAEPDTALHLYGKSQALPGRKMGHVTRITPRKS